MSYSKCQILSIQKDPHKECITPYEVLTRVRDDLQPNMLSHLRISIAYFFGDRNKLDALRKKNDRRK